MDIKGPPVSVIEMEVLVSVTEARVLENGLMNSTTPIVGDAVVSERVQSETTADTPVRAVFVYAKRNWVDPSAVLLVKVEEKLLTVADANSTAP